MKQVKVFFTMFLALYMFSCTKLEEKFRGELEQNNSGITATGLLTNAYNSLNGPLQWGDFWHISEHPSDEIIGPTRGPDWDDNGNWRALNVHTWSADHSTIAGAFNGLLSVQFAASNVLQFNPTAVQAAEAKFIRALSIYQVLDGWGQVPVRDDLTDYSKPPKTLQGTEAADFVISELNAIMNDLPDNGPTAAFVANKNAARALLMKVYLNKGTFANRATPTYPAADMTQVITLADQIIASGKYSLIGAGKYFDNFAPTNNAISTENIFTLYNDNAAGRGGNVQGNTFSISHYNMNPGGWNGFATLSDFYDKFQAGDERLGGKYVYPGSLPNPGNRKNVGFLLGQQYNLTTDAALQDRKNNPLSFTRAVSLIETGNNLEITGIRVIKYPYDYNNFNSQNNNDWVVFRYADVLLMKAEALLRNNNAAGALTIVNSVRAARGASPLASLDLNGMLDERGRELYWEGSRRNDLIRFGKFLGAWQEKPASNARALLFPIPSSQLSVNPNLQQNPGYN